MNEFAIHVKTNFGKELCAWQEEEKLKIPPNNLSKLKKICLDPVLVFE